MMIVVMIRTMMYLMMMLIIIFIIMMIFCSWLRWMLLKILIYFTGMMQLILRKIISKQLHIIELFERYPLTWIDDKDPLEQLNSPF